MKYISMVLFAMVFWVCVGTPNITACYAQNDYEIILKDGRSIIVPSYYERDGFVWYQKYGANVRLNKSKIKTIKKLTVKKDVETVDYKGTEENNGKENTDNTYTLYSEALNDKRDAKFKAAERKLSAALDILKDKKDKVKEYQKIEEELKFYLPLEFARWCVENEQLENVEQTLKPVEKYIQNNPRRFEMRSQIEAIYNAMREVQRNMCDRAEQDAQNIAGSIDQYFSSTQKKELPPKKTLIALMRYEPINDFEVEGSKDETILIKVFDKSKGCQRGKTFIMKLPSRESGWE